MMVEKAPVKRRFLHMRPGSKRGKAADFCRVDGDIDEKCKKVYNRMPKKYI